MHKETRAVEVGKEDERTTTTGRKRRGDFERHHGQITDEQEKEEERIILTTTTMKKRPDRTVERSKRLRRLPCTNDETKMPPCLVLTSLNETLQRISLADMEQSRS